MILSTRMQTIAVLAVGAIFGYVAASSRSDVIHRANAGPSRQITANQAKPLALDPAQSSIEPKIDRAGMPRAGTCCTKGSAKSQLIAMANFKAAAAAANLQADRQETQYPVHHGR